MSTDALTDEDKKYWAPIDPLVNWLANRLPANAKVLEIGPGYVPFPRAQWFVDYKPLPNLPQDRVVSVDLNQQALPYPDKLFDFVYCRHVIEDMYNPILLLKEMARVGKAGYIETPSPMAELCRGVDGASPPFRGYHHHHNICWMHDGELRLIHKYPIIEYIRFSEPDITGWLRKGPKLWNTYYLWEDKIKFKHIQSGPDFVITKDYSTILKNAMDQSEIASGMFFQGAPDTMQISQGALPSLTQNQKVQANV